MYDLAGFSAHSGHWQQVGTTIPGAEVAKFAVSSSGSAAWLLKNGDLWTSGSSAGSITRTAARLHTHRNTVMRRLERAEALLPRPLTERPWDVAAALELQQWAP